MNIRLWAVSVNLTLTMVVNIFLLIFSAVRYHIHTAILFTWTDYKTIFLPVVSPTLVLLVSPTDRMLPRPSLPAQRLLYSHPSAFFSAWYGCGYTSSCVTYPIKHAVTKRTKSTDL